MVENLSEKIWVHEFLRNLEILMFEKYEDGAGPSGGPDGPIQLKFCGTL